MPNDIITLLPLTPSTSCMSSTSTRPSGLLAANSRPPILTVKTSYHLPPLPVWASRKSVIRPIWLCSAGSRPELFLFLTGTLSAFSVAEPCLQPRLTESSTV